MKILYYLSPHTDAVAIHHELATMLAHTLQPVAEVTVATSTTELTAHSLPAYDLIHLFGCWDKATLKLQQRAHRLHIPTVLSPLGGLQPWVMSHHKASRIMARQREAVQQASAVHLCGKLEADLFDRLGWNRRCALIKNAIVTSLITFDQMCVQMTTLYRKVLDTQARLLLSEQERQALCQLLELGIDDKVLTDEAHCRQLRTTVAALGPEQWRRLWLYAHDEQIELPVKKGLERIQFTTPPVVISQIERFSPAATYAEGHLVTDELTYKHLFTRGKLNDNIQPRETHERRCIIALLNLRHGMDHHTAPLLHLADLYIMMRHEDMDEDRLREIARALGIDRFCERLMTVMHTVLRLSEGFMPFTPRDDKEAAEMTRRITKFGTWA